MRDMPLLRALRLQIVWNISVNPILNLYYTYSAFNLFISSFLHTEHTSNILYTPRVYVTGMLFQLEPSG